MYSKTIFFKNHEVILSFSEPFFLKKDNSLVFGYPINFQNSSFSINNFELGNTIKGYWLKVDFYDTELKITNDILGGYRVYYFRENKKTVISDDYEIVLKHFNNKTQKNKIEYSYWLKHGFTTGQSTFIKGLNKISPASTITINDKSINESSYFKDIARTPNIKLHQKAIHDDLLNTFQLIKNESKKNILLFSGGKDSCLLLQYLLNLKIPFTPVFFKLKPTHKYGVEDLIRVRAVSKLLNLKLVEIEIDLKKIPQDLKEDIAKKQLFDKHFSLLHFIGNKEIKNRFGDQCIIINGQSSDSILSFGPSEESLMSFFRRYIMYRPKSILSRIGLILLIIKTRKCFKLPKNINENLMALFDEYKYTRVLDCSMPSKYGNYILNYIERKTNHLNSYFSKEMYVKILSFSQGSDNQIVVNSSKSAGLKTIMPFATPKIIYSTIKYKDEKKEIKTPKYVIERILEDEFSFFYNKLQLDNINVDNISIDSSNNSLKEIQNLFITKSKQFFI